MATYVNYTSLVADVSNYIERGQNSITDPTVCNQIPRLINAAERKLAQALKLLGQIEVLVDSPAGLQINNPIVTKPDRWRQTVSMNYGTGASNNARSPLFPRDYEYCRNYWPDSTVTDTAQSPLFYAEMDYGHWLIAPTPPANFPLEIIAYMQPALLDPGNENNFWTVYTPNLLLYGALLEAAPFLKGDERIPVWQGFWDRELAMLNGQDLQREMDRAAQRKNP